MRSSNFATNGPPYWLFQYRVSDMQYKVYSAAGFHFASSFQPGPDNQIYITTQDNKLARISNPDQWGGVSFNGSFINMMALDNKIRTGVSIPSFIDARRPEPTHPDFSISSLNCNTIRFSNLCFDNYTATWDFGDGTPLQKGKIIDHHFTNPGLYIVKLSLSANSVTYGITSKKITVLPQTASITGPGNVCTNGDYPTQYFSDILPDVNYKWTVLAGGSLSGPDNLPYADVIWSGTNDLGNIQLQISLENCFLTADKIVNIAQGPSFNWLLPDSICLFDSSLILAASPGGGSFTGTGVSNNIFSPSLAGVGYHVITYTYVDELTCMGQIEKTIKVARCKIPANQSTDCSTILNSIYVAPNPVSDIVQLKSPYVLKFIQLYNSIGQKVAQGQLNNNSIRLPQLAAGIYTLLVYCEKDNSFKSLRLIKL
jgi:hypothetical protein